MIGRSIGECKTCAALRDEVVFLRQLVKKLTGETDPEIRRPDVIAGHIEQSIAEEETMGDDAEVYGGEV